MDLVAFPRTEEVDRLVAAAGSKFLASEVLSPLALVAVGGYGRRELFPYSDVDLIILFDQEPEANSLREPLSRFLGFLWDSSVKASQSVRTVNECCRFHQGNVHLSISLLDVRFVWGHHEVFEALARLLPGFFRSQARALLQSLAALTSARHNKYGNTVYHLEPNIKECPGGIRDVQFLHWAALLAPEKELLRHAGAEVQVARDFLYQLRYFLHQRSGRDSNLLSFELQDQAALALPSIPLTPEGWMRSYYRHARSCFQLSQRALDFIERAETGLVRHFFDRRDKLSSAEFTVSHNQVFLRNPAITLQSLSSVFTLFVFVGRHGIPISWDAERRVRERVQILMGEAVEFNSARVAEFPNWVDWQRLLSQPHAALALRNMHDCGLLAAAFPQWQSIDSLVVRDFYHRYTVDEHSLVAIEAIDELLANKVVTFSHFRELALEDDNLALLRMALLLHDVGKGITPGDHIEGSLRAAEAFLSKVGAPRSDRETVDFLIAHHLDLSMVMNGRDLDDPATARFLSSQIGTYEDLRKLVLLTYADVSAVNPTTMTLWRYEQLWRVYTVAASQLTRELVSERIHHQTQSTATLLALPEVASFLDGFPRRYLRIHSQDQIKQHFSLEQLRLRKGVALEVRKELETYLLTVLAADQSGLFAALCGTLASFGMNIIKAEAASNSSGAALDEIRFSDPARTLELNPDEVERLRWTVECVVKGAIKVSDLLKRRRPASRPHLSLDARSVRFDNEASDSSTLMHFAGNDRPGLLFDLASILTEAGCNIEVVLVSTEGHRAIDVFYIVKNGNKIDNATQESLRSSLALRAC